MTWADDTTTSRPKSAAGASKIGAAFQSEHRKIVDMTKIVITTKNLGWNPARHVTLVVSEEKQEEKKLGGRVIQIKKDEPKEGAVTSTADTSEVKKQEAAQPKVDQPAKKKKGPKEMVYRVKQVHATGESAEHEEPAASIVKEEIA